MTQKTVRQTPRFLRRTRMNYKYCRSCEKIIGDYDCEEEFCETCADKIAEDQDIDRRIDWERDELIDD